MDVLLKTVPGVRIPPAPRIEEALQQQGFFVFVFLLDLRQLLCSYHRQEQLVMTSIHSFIFGCCTAALIAPAFAADGWMTDLPAAMQKAQKENKLVLIDFTGSDWCSACILLRRNVLDTADFREYAADKFVLMEVDLPQRKTFDATLRAKNEAIARRYNIGAYPTVLVINHQGDVLGGFEGNVKSLKDAIAPLDNACTADTIFRQAAMQSGTTKARTLYAAYTHFPTSKSFAASAEALRDQIMQADPDNVTGIHDAAAVQEQARLFLQQRAAHSIHSPAMGHLLRQQLKDALPANRAGVMMELCQHSMGTAETVDDLQTTRRMFEELIPLLPPDEAGEIRHYVDTYFRDLGALLQMLKASRPR